MADCAVARQSHLGVGRIRAAIEVIGVAREALGRRSLENIVDMACCAFQGGVCAGQCVTGIP
jgi:hypothetical protein